MGVFHRFHPKEARSRLHHVVVVVVVVVACMSDHSVVVFPAPVRASVRMCCAGSFVLSGVVSLKIGRRNLRAKKSVVCERKQNFLWDRRMGDGVGGGEVGGGGYEGALQSRGLWKAVEETGDKRLQARVKNAFLVIDRTLALYEIDEIVFSFSGGKDSTVLLHLLRAGYSALTSSTRSEDRRDHLIRTVYFKHPDAFPEIEEFALEVPSLYNLDMEVSRLDFKTGIEALQKQRPIKAIFLGTRLGDPDTMGLTEFAPSSSGWPPYMRVNPILDWTYRDVWAFILACKIPYCKLYDHGYTSIGYTHDTLPNPALCLASKDKYKTADLLLDDRLERAGRLKMAAMGDKERDKIKEKVEYDRVWCSAGVAALLDLYEERWVPMGRGNLKSKHWEEISAELAKQCPQQLRRTGSHCKSKVEKMKKSYRTERMEEEKPGAPLSKWHWYSRMEQLMAGNGKREVSRGCLTMGAAVHCSSSSLDKETLLENAWRLPSPPPPPIGGSSQCPTRVSNPNVDDENGSFSSLPPLGTVTWTTKNKECNTMGATGKPNLKRKRGHEHVCTSLAQAIQSLGEGLVKIECMRAEMELKSREMFLQSQLQLASLFAKNLEEKKRRMAKYANTSTNT